jgi:hypothetical protein
MISGCAGARHPQIPGRAGCWTRQELRRDGRDTSEGVADRAFQQSDTVSGHSHGYHFAQHGMIKVATIPDGWTWGISTWLRGRKAVGRFVGAQIFGPRCAAVYFLRPSAKERNVDHQYTNATNSTL